MEEHLSDVNAQLSSLAEVQLVEGKRQMKMAEQAVDSVETFVMVEVFFLAIIAVAIPILMLYQPKRRRTQEE